MKKLLFILLATLPLCSFGIEPVIFKLDDNPKITYTVPAGKVLLLEHIVSAKSTSYEYINPIFTLRTTNSSYTISIYADPNIHPLRGLISFDRPLKIPENTEIEASDTGDTDGYTIFGMLAEPTELYANIETQSEGMLCQNGNFSFDVMAASARPGKIKLQGSTDLVDWHPIVEATIAKIDPSSHSVSVPIAGNEKYYVKTLLNSVTQ